MYFPIGDIHGCYEPMRNLYDKIVEEIANGIDPAFGGTIVFLGDYIDRGPDSKKVLDFLMGLEDFVINGHNVRHVFLYGNHEDLMVNTRLYPTEYAHQVVWERNGAQETLDSFGVTLEELQAGALDEYIEWMQNLDILWVDPDYVFAHAGYNPTWPFDQQNLHDCIWKQDYQQYTYRGTQKVLVHGHVIKKPNDAYNDIFVDLPNKRIWMDCAMNMFGKAITVGLPQPHDYGVESNNGEDYKRIEAT